MERSSRHGKHGKDRSKRSSKKRKSREENGRSDSSLVVTSTKPLVEYSDVSSEDLSEPEAGEIQSGEDTVLSYSDGEVSNHSVRRNSHHR